MGDSVFTWKTRLSQRRLHVCRRFWNSHWLPRHSDTDLRPALSAHGSSLCPVSSFGVYSLYLVKMLHVRPDIKPLKNLLLFSTEERKSGTTWGRVNVEKMFILGWNCNMWAVSLKPFLMHFCRFFFILNSVIDYHGKRVWSWESQESRSISALARKPERGGETSALEMWESRMESMRKQFRHLMFANCLIKLFSPQIHARMKNYCA